MRAIIVGAGGLTRDLLRRLGKSWEVTVVDLSAARLSRIPSDAVRDIIQGDGSSRVVLTRAGLENADAVVAVTNDDEANLEICRIAREAEILRLVAVACDPERCADYRKIGVPAFSPDSLAARRVELNLETRRVASTAFAGGLAEAIEFRVAHDSPVQGVALRDLHARSWIVGAILRKDKLIIPHGDTHLEEDDLVTVVGAGADFSEIVRTFTSGVGRFPLGYGKRVAVALAGEADLEGPIPEAIHLVRNSRASSLLVVHRDPERIRDESRAARERRLAESVTSLAEAVEVRFRPVAGSPSRFLRRIPEEESVGVLVLPGPRGHGPTGWKTALAATSLAGRTRRPVLVSRGTHPYRSILVPARRTASGRTAARVAIDLARLSAAELTGIAVVDPFFLAGPGALVEARQAIAWLEEDAAVQGVQVVPTIRRGNPVRAIVDAASEVRFLILASSHLPHSLSIRTGIAAHVVRRSHRSVLVVPDPGHA